MLKDFDDQIAALEVEQARITAAGDDAIRQNGEAKKTLATSLDVGEIATALITENAAKNVMQRCMLLREQTHFKLIEARGARARFIRETIPHQQRIVNSLEAELTRKRQIQAEIEHKITVATASLKRHQATLNALPANYPTRKGVEENVNAAASTLSEHQMKLASTAEQIQELEQRFTAAKTHLAQMRGEDPPAPPQVKDEPAKRKKAA